SPHHGVGRQRFLGKTDDMTTATRLRAPIRLADYVVYIGFAAIFLFFAATLYDRGFLSIDNMMTIVRQTTPVAVMAVGMTFAMSPGQIDLSIGAIVALAALITALVLRDYGIAPAVIIGLLVGVLIGAVNGALTVFLRIPSLLVTLGTMGIIAGLGRSIT